MKRPKLLFLLVAALVLPGWTGFGAAFSEWQYQQTFDVAQKGLVKLSLPPETLSVSRADLADVRIVSGAGQEVPYLIYRPGPSRGPARGGADFKVELQSGATVITFRTDLERPLGKVTLESPGDNFIKAVAVAGSNDRVNWQELVSGAPVFRQGNGSGQLSIPLPGGVWRYLRLTVDDRSSSPVPFTGASVEAETAEPLKTELLKLRVQDRTEEAGQTRMVLDLGAAHLHLASLQVSAKDPLFRRVATVATRVVEDNTIQERTLGSATILRTAAGGAGRTEEFESLVIPIDAQAESRELLLLIQNGDSPPLQIEEVTARRVPTYVVFYGSAAGNYRLLCGNPPANKPHYDLTGLGGDLERLSEADIAVSTVQANPDYRRPDRLPDVQETGPVLDVSEWAYRKAITVKAGGVQQVDLDLDVLAEAQPGFGDLRVMRQDKQVPFILERSSVSRSLKPDVARADDPKQKNVSRWLLRLPRTNLPLEKLQCSVATALFTRGVVLYEEPLDDRGNRYRHDLGRATWVQSQDAVGRTFGVTLNSRPATDSLVLEIDNGDNPAIEISGFEFKWPVTRVFFKTSVVEPMFLYYGKRDATAPRYDLGMVAGQLLLAEKQAAALGAQEEVNPASWAGRQAKEKAGWIFWGVLGVVVVLLLVIIGKMVPKQG